MDEFTCCSSSPRNSAHLGRRYGLLLAALLLPFLIGMQCGPNENRHPGDLHAMRGLEAFDAGDYDRAIAELTSAAEVGVVEYDLAEIYTIKGQAYDRLDQFDEALVAHQKAVETNPNSHQAWNNLGITYFYLGDLNQAKASHRRALALQPDYAFAYASLGAVHVTANEPDQAIEVLERAVSLNGRIATAHANLALAYAMVGRFPEAEASLKQAIVLGYENSAIVQERINNLKALEQ